MKTTFTLLLLSFLLLGCSKPVPPVSNFKVEEITNGRAAIFGPDTWHVLDSVGNYASGVLDSIELSGEVARTAVTTLLAGRNYTLPDYSATSDGFVAYGVLCHNPHFVLQAFDSEGRRTNLFTICFTCGNVRMTNYWKYPKSDEFMMSLEGEKAFSALQDDLFPDFKGTFFWDPYHSLRE